MEEQKKKKNRFKVTVGWFLAASVFMHITFFASMALIEAYSNRTPPAYSHQTIEIELPSEPKTKIEDIKAKQIVDMAKKPLNNETPEKEAYLSRNNQRVEKETVAANRGEFQNLKTNDAKAITSPNLAERLRTKPAAQSAKVPDPVQKQTAKAKDLPFDPFGDVKKGLAQKSFEEAASERAQQKTPSPSEASTANVSQTNDYVKTNVGNETILNTREFKYFTYYERIRKQLSQHWEPKVREKLKDMFRQGRTIASSDDHITKLLIVLNQAGDLVNVQKVSESGVQDLDDAAVEAFKSAAPFPNPPKGIIDGDGTVKIRWDFVLES